MHRMIYLMLCIVMAALSEFRVPYVFGALIKGVDVAGVGCMLHISVGLMGHCIMIVSDYRRGSRSAVNAKSLFRGLSRPHSNL